jgi:hypothetical protein
MLTDATIDRLDDRLDSRLAAASTDADVAASAEALLRHLDISWDELTALLRHGLMTHRRLAHQVPPGWQQGTPRDGLRRFVSDDGRLEVVQCVGGEWLAYHAGKALRDYRGRRMVHPYAAGMMTLAVLMSSGAEIG